MNKSFYIGGELLSLPIIDTISIKGINIFTFFSPLIGRLDVPEWKIVKSKEEPEISIIDVWDKYGTKFKLIKQG